MFISSLHSWPRLFLRNVSLTIKCPQCRSCFQLPEMLVQCVNQLDGNCLSGPTFPWFPQMFSENWSTSYWEKVLLRKARDGYSRTPGKISGPIVARPRFGLGPQGGLILCPFPWCAFRIPGVRAWAQGHKGEFPNPVFFSPGPFGAVIENGGEIIIPGGKQNTVGGFSNRVVCETLTLW